MDAVQPHQDQSRANLEPEPCGPKNGYASSDSPSKINYSPKTIKIVTDVSIFAPSVSAAILANYSFKFLDEISELRDAAEIS